MATKKKAVKTSKKKTAVASGKKTVAKGVKKGSSARPMTKAKTRAAHAG